MSTLYLFDDARARSWAPLSATRPVGELLFGCLLLRERAARAFAVPCAGHLAGEGLAGFEEDGAPPVVAPGDVPREGRRIFLSSRFVPTDTVEAPAGPAALVADDRVVGWVLPDGAPAPTEESLLRPDEAPATGERADVRGTLLDWPWSLVAANADRITRDVEKLYGPGDAFRLAECHILGSQPVSLGSKVTVEPGVTLDVRDGPIRLDDRVRVQGPARLTGPLYVGPDCLVFGGSLTHASMGPVCKVRGEIEASVLLGYCNKAHDGYLGHAYLGRWVNLGALTTNSDLKNNYSAVRVQVAPAREVDTGLLKVGVFFGDHVKTGIGTMLNTGTVLGMGTNVFGGAMPPKWVPPFSWGVGEELTEYRMDKFLEVAAAAMARRDVPLTDGTRDLMTRLFERTRDQRTAP